jgi:O-antigen ligase
LLAACFFLGGSARGNVASLMILRPISILLLGFGLWHLRWSQVKAHRFLVALALAILAIPALQMIPLPPEVWSNLPGRDLVMEIDRVAGLGRIWRPLSLTPDASRNALYAAVVPFTVLILGIQLSFEERSRLLPMVLILCGVSALLGLLQTLGDPQGPLYFYDVTNNGSAVGLFANRNHQALLLAMMLPILALLARGSGAGAHVRRLIALASGLALLPLILITGSRAGLIVAGVALLAIPLILGRVRRSASEAPVTKSGRINALPFAWQAGLVLAGSCLIVLTLWLGRDVAWDRMLASESAGEDRFKILPTLISMILAYAPAGTGMGSFMQIYQVHEPDALLTPKYMNHAHNDWLEVLLDGGAVAALLLAIAIIGFLIQSKRAFSVRAASSAPVQFARLGLVMVLLSALASVSDYPLRVPSLASLFTLAVLWASCTLPKSQPLGEV